MKNRFFSFFRTKFGISDMERGAVFTSWGLRFLYQIGLVVSWTILVALFVEQFGIMALPFLFLVEAILILFGSFFSSYILSRISLSSYLKYTIVGTFFCLFCSLFFAPSSFLFFVFLIFAKGLFFSQLSIGLHRRTETLFSTTQAQRFFSFIESSITLGALFGALLTLFFLSFLPTQLVLMAWAFSLVFMFIIVVFTPRWLSFIPGVSKKSQDFSQTSFSHAFHIFRRISFLRIMGLILVFQAFVFMVIEVDFTKSVYSHIPTSQQQTLSDFSFDSMPLHASLFSDIPSFFSDVGHEIHNEMNALSSQLIMHESLAHDLGMFHLIFAFLALLFQFFITPQALKAFGVIRTFLSYFVGLLLFFAGFVFGYIPVNIVRLFQHTTHSLAESSYHISYYSISHNSRESLRLFFEGILKPLGILLAVLFLLLFPDHSLFWISLLALVLVVVLAFFLKKPFTQLSQINLESRQDLKEKINAIQVLAQKGHSGAIEVLTSELLHLDNHSIIRETLIKTLADIGKPEVIHSYIQVLSNPKEDLEMKRFVLLSLSRVHIPSSYWENHAFTRYHLLETLKTLFHETKDHHIKEKIVMSIFQHLPSHDSAPFFLETMESADDRLKSIYLRSCRYFQDPEIVFYVRKYLDHSSSRLKSHAVMALWAFEDQNFLRRILYSLLHSKNSSDQVSAMYAFGEIQDFESIDLLKPFLKHHNRDVRLHALIALAKMKQSFVLAPLLSFLFGKDISFSKKTFYMLQRVPSDFRMMIQREIQRQVSLQVSEILQTHDLQSESFSSHVFSYLKHLYWLSGRYDDLLLLEKI